MPKNKGKRDWVNKMLGALGWISERLGAPPEHPLVLADAPRVHSNQVTGRLEFDGDGGTLSKLIVAGRPTRKHGGLHGQHTTAYAVTKESMVNAMPVGCTEDQAKARVAKLFANLLQYPTVRDIEDDADAFKALCTRLSDTATWGPTTLAEAVATYAELRDALPGASLPGELIEDTTGSGEGEALKQLRRAEKAVAAGPATPPKDRRKDKVLNCLKLMDFSALERLSTEDRITQAEIYLRSLAQSFPETFLSPYDGETKVGQELCEALTQALNPPEAEEGTSEGGSMDESREEAAHLDADALWAACQAMALDLRLPEGTERGTGENFGAALSSPDADGKRRLEFQGRPASQKDSKSDGNHMTSFRTVSADVSARLMPDGQIPTAAELHERVTSAIAAFDPSNYMGLFPNLTAGLDEDAALAVPEKLLGHFFYEGQRDESLKAIEDSEHATMFKRLGLLLYKRDELEAYLGDPPEEGSAAASEKVDPNRLMAIGELVLAMIDERPTSVLYSGVAGGHGEGVYGQKLDLLETDTGGATSEEALELLSHQLDIRALHETEEKFGGAAGYGGEDAGDKAKIAPAAFSSMVIDEFCDCAMRLYPNVVDLVLADLDRDGMEPDAVMDALIAKVGAFVRDWEDPDGQKKRKKSKPSPGDQAKRGRKMAAKEEEDFFEEQ